MGRDDGISAKRSSEPFDKFSAGSDAPAIGWKGEEIFFGVLPRVAPKAFGATAGLSSATPFGVVRMCAARGRVNCFGGFSTNMSPRRGF